MLASRRSLEGEGGRALVDIGPVRSWETTLKYNMLIAQTGHLRVQIIDRGLSRDGEAEPQEQLSSKKLLGGVVVSALSLQNERCLVQFPARVVILGKFLCTNCLC